MARTIDLSKPLSDDDRQYLVTRDRWRDLAEADGHNDPQRARQEAQEGYRRTQVASTVLSPTSPGQTPRVQEPDAGGDGDEPPYEEWTFEELKAELKDRKAEALESGMSENEAKERYSLGGSQKDLVDRLYADDSAKTEE